MAVNRKEAIREFKARKVPRGVFEVRSAAAGRVWVESSPNLDAARNGLWFMLRNGSHGNKELQAEWNQRGAEALQFHVLETLDDDVPAMGLNDLLKEKKRHWAAKLSALMLSPV